MKHLYLGNSVVVDRPKQNDYQLSRLAASKPHTVQSTCSPSAAQMSYAFSSVFKRLKPLWNEEMKGEQV